MGAHKLFKINQDVVLKNNKGEILILKQNELWKLPGGRLEDNETPHEGLLREIKEETGIEKCKIEEIIVPELSESKNTYRMTFLCSTDEKNIVLSDEHTEYAWINKKFIESYNFAFDKTKEIIKKFL